METRLLTDAVIWLGEILIRTPAAFVLLVTSCATCVFAQKLGQPLPGSTLESVEAAAGQQGGATRRASDDETQRAIIEKAQTFIQDGDLAAARNKLTQALKSYPANGGLYDLLGVVEVQQGHYREAESSFRKAIQHSPGLTGAYLNLGRLYQENLSKNPDGLRKAVATYLSLLKIQPDSVEANYQVAFLLLREKSYQASLDYLSRLSQEDQEKPQALAVRVVDLAGLQNFAEADAAADRLLASPRLTETDILQILPTLESQHSDGISIRLLEGIVQRGLASPAALTALGLVYARQEKLDQARETLEKAATVKPDSVELLIQLAQVAEKQRDRKGALGYLAHARDLDPQNASVHFFFGIVAAEENLGQEAYNSLKKAVSLDPNNPYYNYALGAVAVDREDPGDSVAAFQKYRAAKPDDPRGILALGIAQFKSRFSEEARKSLQEAARHRETAAVANFHLARLSNQEGKVGEALKEIEAALAFNPNYASAHAERGILLMKQKDYAGAAKALERAVEIDPDNYPANLNLMILYQRTDDSRAGAQARRFEEIKKKRSQKALESLRTIEVRPNGEP